MNTSASTWAELAAACRSCTACAPLVAERGCVVVGHAPAGARMVIVGEAPGAEEDRTGEPFVGRAGRLLDELLADAGLSRDRVALLNTLKCRPPGNRAPRPEELAACRPWLRQQLDLLDPLVVCALGLTAARWFLGPRLRLADVRGQVLSHGGRRLVVSYHPSAALRFGPAGAPRALLRDDLALAASTLAASTLAASTLAASTLAASTSAARP